MTPRMFVSGIVQYSWATTSMGTNLRFRWEYRPGSELFVVYTDDFDAEARWAPALRNRALVVKLNRFSVPERASRRRPGHHVGQLFRAAPSESRTCALRTIENRSRIRSRGCPPSYPVDRSDRRRHVGGGARGAVSAGRRRGGVCPDRRPRRGAERVGCGRVPASHLAGLDLQDPACLDRPADRRHPAVDTVVPWNGTTYDSDALATVATPWCRPSGGPCCRSSSRTARLHRPRADAPAARLTLDLRGG